MSWHVASATSAMQATAVGAARTPRTAPGCLRIRRPTTFWAVPTAQPAMRCSRAGSAAPAVVGGSYALRTFPTCVRPPMRVRAAATTAARKNALPRKAGSGRAPAASAARPWASSSASQCSSSSCWSALFASGPAIRGKRRRRGRPQLSQPRQRCHQRHTRWRCRWRRRRRCRWRRRWRCRSKPWRGRIRRKRSQSSNPCSTRA
mmetsp:Transcript_7858/g.25943  ORF Transcript_7858/g.25943 Transcript_7858/m.25943 type:complete len:204 (+) Transcript_7858:294-905(+)